MTPYLLFMGFAAMAAALRRAFPPVWVLFIIAALLFVGLRYETAFDWPTYKGQFEAMAHMRVSDLGWAANRWNHEIGYVVVAFLSAQALPEYEWFQLLAFALFLYSLRYLSRAVKGDSWALYTILAFLMFSLLMSTMRQCIAISLFNIGLGMMIRGKSRPAVGVMFALALAFHTSIIAYLGILAVARLDFGNKALAVAVRAVVAAFVANVLIFAINASNVFPKLAYYLGRSGQDSSLEMIFFATAMLTVFGFSILTVPMHRGCKGAILVRYCAISAAAALALMGFVPTLRNRIFYELIIIAALIAPHCYRGKLYRAALVALATVFFLAQFARQAAVGFVPYQNYVVHEITDEPGDGAQRQREVKRLTRMNF